MDIARPLAVITPTVDGDVLAVLAGAEAAFSGRRVHQVAARHSERGVRNALHRLCEQGIVRRERIGSADMYQFNSEHLAAPHIKAIVHLRAELFQRISAKLHEWTLATEFVALFGSAARGDMRPDSDIDILVVRPDAVDVDDEDWRRQLDALSHDVTAWTGNEARLLELAAREVRAGLLARKPVLEDIRNEGIVLHGSRSYLNRTGRHPTGGDGHG